MLHRVLWNASPFHRLALRRIYRVVEINNKKSTRGTRSGTSSHSVINLCDRVHVIEKSEEKISPVRGEENKFVGYSVSLTSRPYRKKYSKFRSVQLEKDSAMSQIHLTRTNHAMLKFASLRMQRISVLS